MNTYIITYKLFSEWHKDTEEWDVEEGVMSIQATSEREATVKAQETIGLYVLTCQLGNTEASEQEKVNPLELHDDEYEQWIEKAAHECIEQGLPIAGEAMVQEIHDLEATLTDEDKAAYARYLKSSIDPREIEDEKFYTFEIKGKETKELIAVVIYNCTSEQKAYGRVEEDAAGDIYELVKVEPVI